MIQTQTSKTDFYLKKKEIIYMVNLQSKNFQLIWGTWILILGLSLFFVHTIENVHSFSEYLNAFVTLDMPSSWCPTFLTLYGIATLAAYALADSGLKKAFTAIALFAGLVLLPIGIYATYTFTIMETFAFDFMYIYAQTIHISEILTGLGPLTIFLLAKLKK